MKLNASIVLMLNQDKTPQGHVMRISDEQGHVSYFYRGRTFSQERTNALGMRMEVLESHDIEVSDIEFEVTNARGRVLATCEVTRTILGVDGKPMSWSVVKSKNSTKNLGEVMPLPFLVSETLCTSLHNDIQVYKIGSFAFPINKLEKLDIELLKRGEN